MNRFFADLHSSGTTANNVEEIQGIIDFKVSPVVVLQSIDLDLVPNDDSDSDSDSICIGIVDVCGSNEITTECSPGVTAETVAENSHVSIDTLSDLSAADIPESGIFSKPISSVFECKIDESVWTNLSKHKYSVQTKTGIRWALKQGTWQPTIANLMKKGNPYCSYLFKRHGVHGSHVRAASSDKLFSACSYCGNKSCNLKKIDVLLTNNFTFSVKFNANTVRHEIATKAARPISGVQREAEIALHKENNRSASVEFARRMATLDADVFISGKSRKKAWKGSEK